MSVGLWSVMEFLYSVLHICCIDYSFRNKNYKDLKWFWWYLHCKKKKLDVTKNYRSANCATALLNYRTLSVIQVLNLSGGSKSMLSAKACSCCRRYKVLTRTAHTSHTSLKKNGQDKQVCSNSPQKEHLYCNNNLHTSLILMEIELELQH